MPPEWKKISQIACKVTQLRENIDFLTLRKRISIILKKLLIKRKKISKSQNFTKHGVENLVAMATTYTLDKKFSEKFIGEQDSGKFFCQGYKLLPWQPDFRLHD